MSGKQTVALVCGCLLVAVLSSFLASWAAVHEDAWWARAAGFWGLVCTVVGVMAAVVIPIARFHP